MRHTMRALLSMLLVVSCCQSALAETSGRRWWHFGAKEEPPTATAPPTTAAPAFTPSPSTGLPPSPDITPIGPQSAAPQSAVPQLTPQAQTRPAQLPQNPRDADRPPVIESPFANFKWPTMKVPEWPRSKPTAAPPDLSHAPQQPPRNAWVEKAPEPTKPSPMQSLSDGAHRVGNRTRAAWRKTVDAITPGEPDPRTPPRIAGRDTKPPFWKRMFAAEEEEPQGAQTIQGFIAQERLDP